MFKILTITIFLILISFNSFGQFQRHNYYETDSCKVEYMHYKGDSCDINNPVVDLKLPSTSHAIGTGIICTSSLAIGAGLGMVLYGYYEHFDNLEASGYAAMGIGVTGGIIGLNFYNEFTKRLSVFERIVIKELELQKKYNIVE